MTVTVELSGNQCLEELHRHGVGGVAFNTPLGPRIVLVRYLLAGSEILFRTTPYSDVGTYAPDSQVAFEIDDADAEGHCGCSVVARGRAEIVDLPDEPAGRSSRGPGGSHHDYRWIKVRAHDFAGVRVTESPGRPGDMAPADAGTSPQ